MLVKKSRPLRRLGNLRTVLEVGRVRSRNMYSIYRPDLFIPCVWGGGSCGNKVESRDQK